jgi:hypothetical protein
MMTLMMILSSILIGSGVWDDAYLPLEYSGLWSSTSDPSAYEGAYQTSSDGTLTFVFEGSSFAIYGVQTVGGGTANVCVDGECVTASWYAPVTLHTVEIVSITGLANIEHTVTVTAVGDGDIAIDAIYIAPQLQPTPQLEATAEPTPSWITSNDIQGVDTVFVREITTGDQATFLMLFALVFLTMAGFVLQIWRGGN